MANIIDFFRRDKAADDVSNRIQWVFAGLGNPGPRYEGTRHNVGYRAVDRLAGLSGVSVDRSRFRGLCAETSVANRRVLLLKPQTFMNLSGESIGEALAWYKLPASRLIVFHDDVSIPVGRLRVRGKGSAGGHNGLKDIIRILGSDEFARVKIGVGSPENPGYDLADWVLSKISSSDLDDALIRANEAAELIVSEGVAAAMNRFNGSIAENG
ncbi:MAG: aminoacyl-tRNA hydrolase [Clostridiaceae bacterium]|nr:aminoacyl-tRNA hydrolase [Clostridiaceae bacterium]